MQRNRNIERGMERQADREGQAHGKGYRVRQRDGRAKCDTCTRL